jgi:hypothetical protein
MLMIDDCAVNEPVRGSSRRKMPEAKGARRLIDNARINSGFPHPRNSSYRHVFSLGIFALSLALTNRARLQSAAAGSASALRLAFL